MHFFGWGNNTNFVYFYFLFLNFLLFCEEIKFCNLLNRAMMERTKRQTDRQTDKQTSENDRRAE
jgi:hypothetical protein